MGKVRYGLENVHYALVKPGGTFDVPKPLKGAVALSIEPEGDSKNFFADNGAYVTFTTNAGYSGELELAALEDDDVIALLGEKKATNGVVYESSDSQPASFALLYKIKGNVNDQAFAFYNCTLSRPSREANTTTDTTDPDTVKLKFAAIPIEITVTGAPVKITKASIENTEQNKKVYDKWFSEVCTPATATV